MNNLSSKKADEAKNRPIMNLGVELPEFDKAKYPHGGYGQLHSFGWRILDQKEYRKPETGPRKRSVPKSPDRSPPVPESFREYP